MIEFTFGLAGGVLIGHFWGGTIWPYIKAKIWPGSVPIPPAGKS